MAYLSGGDTLPDDETRSATRGAGSRPWDRRGDVPATAADRGLFWAPAAVEEVQYPTRMARRRALQAAQILDGWQPDPVLTAPVLARVGDELLRLFDGSPAQSPAAAEDDEVAPEPISPAVPVRDDVPARAASRRRRRAPRGSSSSSRTRWRRRGQAVAAAEPAVDPGDGAAGGPQVVRQDDPVDDAAWFAGLKQMALADDAAEDRAGPLTQKSAEPPAEEPVHEPAPDDELGPGSVKGEQVVERAVADVRQIVPASVPRPRSTARRNVAVAIAALLVIGAGVAVALNRTGPDVTAPAGTSVTPQQTIVVAFSLSPQAAADARGPVIARKTGTPSPQAPTSVQAGDVTGLSLLAVGGGSAQQVLVPSRLLLDVPGAGRVPMSRSLVGSPNAPGQAVTDALEVRVDTTWTLDSTALKALVDRVGGVVVDVDADVTKGTQVGAAVLVAAGPQQKLAGAQAALFAQFLGADEPEAARLARQEQVLRAVLAALPDDPATIRTIVGDLPGAPTGATLDAVTRVLSAARLAAASNELASTVLPVREIDAGGAVVAYGLDDKAAVELVAGRLAGARLPVAAVGHVRVLVQNGVGTPGLGDSARSALLAAGLRYVGGGNLPGFGQKQTVVLLRDASSASRERGMAVARALGMDGSALRISETAPTVADIVVILGQDYVRS